MKGMMFTDEMLQAAMEGRKTVTRRLINPPPPKETISFTPAFCDESFYPRKKAGKGSKLIKGVCCKPFYKEGTHIYIKEPYYVSSKFTGIKGENAVVVFYNIPPDVMGVKWKNKMFMPEKYARNYAYILDARPERLGDITDSEARLEGCRDREDFIRVWREIHGLNAWQKGVMRAGATCWVWRYQFEFINTHTLRKVVTT